jgi:hypothetical protein
LRRLRRRSPFILPLSFVRNGIKFIGPDHRDTLVKTACRLCFGSVMQIIYCCPIWLGGEIFNYTGFKSVPLILCSRMSTKNALCLTLLIVW